MKKVKQMEAFLGDSIVLILFIKKIPRDEISCLRKTPLRTESTFQLKLNIQHHQKWKEICNYIVKASIHETGMNKKF